MGIHDTCNNIATHEGFTLVCRRSVEHTDSSQPERRLHYTPDHGDLYWNKSGVVSEDAGTLIASQ